VLNVCKKSTVTFSAEQRQVINTYKYHIAFPLIHYINFNYVCTRR